MSNLAAGKMFCLSFWAPLLPTYKAPFVGSQVRCASATACNGNGKSFIWCTAPAQCQGCSWHQSQQSSQIWAEPLHVPCATRGGRETSALHLWDRDGAQEHWSTQACVPRAGSFWGSRGLQTACRAVGWLEQEHGWKYPGLSKMSTSLDATISSAEGSDLLCQSNRRTYTAGRKPLMVRTLKWCFKRQTHTSIQEWGNVSTNYTKLGGVRWGSSV